MPATSTFRRLPVLALVSIGFGLVGCDRGPRPTDALQPQVAARLPHQPVRYVDHVFRNVDVQTGVGFGRVVQNGVPVKLLMDVFLPRGDTAPERAVLILAHDGGFVTGTRHNQLVQAVAIDFASRGWVTASIDYRLLQGPVTSLDAAHIAILQCVHDLKAAVRYFREDAAGPNLFRADIDAIFAGGQSAGAAIAAMAGVLDAGDAFSPGVAAFLAAHGGIDGDSSTNTQFASDIAGVYAVSGGVTDLAFVGANSTPMYCAHEQFDFVVPCGTATVNFSGQPMSVSGSCVLVPALQARSVGARLFLVPGAATHLGYTAAQWKQMDNEAAAFLAALIP